jgi:hypothetical protein
VPRKKNQPLQAMLLGSQIKNKKAKRSPPNFPCLAHRRKQKTPMIKLRCKKANKHPVPKMPE